MAGSQDCGSVLFCPPSVFGRDAMRGSLGEKINQGGTADIHAWAPGQVVKLFKEGFPPELGKQEARMTQAEIGRAHV